VLTRTHTTGRSPLDVSLRLPPVLRLLRPGQWAKNALCLGAPLAAGVLDRPAVLARTLMTVVAFTLVAAAVYAANDVVDADDDRAHPDKRLRPVASGAVGPGTALAIAGVCAACGAAVAGMLGWLTLTVIGAYGLSSAAYVLRLRRVPVLDVVTVAVGFVLRALAGAAATGLAVSSWFLLVALFGSLLLVCAKRRAELFAAVGRDRARTTLDQYTVGWLDQVVTLALTGTVLAYAMWAFQSHGEDVIRSVLAVSVLPVLVALLRYLLLVDRGSGERPEVTVVDPMLLGCAGVWAGLLAVGLYLA
jgi:decaprenyl-phosphate phosphoribosyltransferase